MTLDNICNLPMERIAADDCVLFIWVTYPMLREGLRVIREWGFTYKTIAFQWVKTYPKQTDKFFFGIGRWTRSNTECCLLAVRGKPKRQRNDISQLIVSPVMRHSVKPNEARERIKLLMGDMKAVELFARTTCDGWDCWGNEVLH